MAEKYIIRKIGNATNTPVSYFDADDADAMNSIDTTNLAMGSECYVINSSTTYALNSNKQWKPVSRSNQFNDLV